MRYRDIDTPPGRGAAVGRRADDPDDPAVRRGAVVGKLPTAAFARPEPDRPGASWLAAWHAAEGNPHTDADCDLHRGAPSSALADDPLDATDNPPTAYREAFGEAASRDVEERGEFARPWRAAAQEVASATDEVDTQATWQFLRTRFGLGLPVPGLAQAVVPAGHGVGGKTLAELLALMREPAFVQSLDTYQDRAYLVPHTALDSGSRADGRMPSFHGALDLGSGRQARTIHLPPGGASLTPRGRGILLLFEARHAMERSASVSPSMAEYWSREAALHALEFRVLSRLGGDAYRAVVDQYLRALREAGDLLDEPRNVMSHDIAKSLEQIFGRDSLEFDEMLSNTDANSGVHRR